MATLGSNSVIKVKVSSTGGLSPTSTPLTLKNAVSPDRLDRLTDVNATNETSGAVPVYDSNTDSYVVRQLSLGDLGLSISGANNSGVLSFNEQTNAINTKLLAGTPGEIEIDSTSSLITFGLPNTVTLTTGLTTATINANNVVANNINRSPKIDITLTGDVTGSANTTLTNLSNGALVVNTTLAVSGFELGVQTTGSYVANIANGTGVFIGNTSGGETETPVISIGQDVSNTANVTFVDITTLSANILTANIGALNASNVSVTNELVTHNILPAANNTYDIGSPDNRFQSLYLSGNTIVMGNVVFEDTTTSLSIVDNTGTPISLDVGNTTVNGTLTVVDSLAAGDLESNNLTITGYANIANANIASINRSPTINVEMTGDVTGTANVTLTNLSNATLTIATTVAPNSVALGTDTTGAYVANITSGTGVSISNTTGGENQSPVISIGQDVSTTAAVTFGSANVTGNVVVAGELTVSNTASIGNTNIQGFANVSGNATIGEVLTARDVVIAGNLTVSGTTTVINTTELEISDNFITLNSDVIGSPVQDAGIEVRRGTSANVSLYWDEVNDNWAFTQADGTTRRAIASNTDVSNAYANAVAHADAKAANAYSNAVSYADTKSTAAYTNAVSVASADATTKSDNAYSNAALYADARAATAYSNAVLTAAFDATNKASNAYSNAISRAATDASTKAATAYSNAVATAAADATTKADLAYAAAVATAGNDSDAKAANAYSNAVLYADTKAATAYSNAVTVAAADAFSRATTAYTNAINFAFVRANDAYSNAVTYTNTKAANTYANAVAYTDTKAATAYSNAVIYVDTQAGQAYTNAVSYTDSVATTTYNNAAGYADIKAGQAYSNATSYTDTAISVKANVANPTFSGNVTANVIIVNQYIDFSNTLSAPSHKEGRVFYDRDSKTLAYYTGEPDVTMNIGQEFWTWVYNNTGSDIPNGSAVRFTGSQSGIPTVALADASSMTGITWFAGVATHSIENGSYGYVTSQGRVSGVDLSTFNVGAALFISADTPGGFTSTPPTYPNYPLMVGGVLSNTASGVLMVKSEIATFATARVAGNLRVDGDVTIAGDLTLLGNTTTTSVTSLSVGNTFIYLTGGDQTSNASFTGTGLNDVDWDGHLQYSNTTTFYVKIVSTGATDTFAWSRDNFATVEANNVSITGGFQWLGGGALIKFESTTGHTLNDVWSATLTPVNVDSGIVGNFHTGENGMYAHAGYFRDASDGKFKFFTGYTPEPGASIDTSHASFHLADIVANSFTGSFTGGINGNADSATALQTARKIQLTGDAAGNVMFDGSTNVEILTTISTIHSALTVANTLVTGNTTVNGTFDVVGNVHLVGNTLFVDSSTTRVGILTTSPTAALTVGEGGATLTTPVIQVTDTQNSYIQVAVQNLSNGTHASSDFVLTADNGTDLTNYVDVGIGSSGYNYPEFNVVQPLDGYFYTHGGRTLIGTGANKDIVFFTGNTTAGSEKIYFYANGDTNFLHSMVVNGSITTNTLVGSIDASNVVSGTISNSRLTPANTTVAGITQLVDSTSNDSITIAATANSVKTALSLAVANAATAYSNAVSYADTAAATAYSNAISVAAADATTKAATAYSNAVSTASADATTKTATAYSNAVSYTDTKAAAAYSNAVSTASADATTKSDAAYSNAISYADTKADAAYSNAVSIAATDATNKAANAYSNAISYADTKAAAAYSNAISYADVAAAAAYANAIQDVASNTYVDTTFAKLAGATFTGAVTVNSVFTAGNTTITGFANLTNNVTVGGTLTGRDIVLSGNLTVAGTVTTINTNQLEIGDNIITLNADYVSGSPTQDAGIEVRRGSSANSSLVWSENGGKWKVNNGDGVYHNIIIDDDLASALVAANTNAYVAANAAYSNAVSVAATDATTKANDAYSNAVSVASADATTKASAAYSNAIATAAVDATNKAANAFSNATSYAATVAATSYSNAISHAAADATTKAATAYSNATSYADTKAAAAYSNAVSYTDGREAAITIALGVAIQANAAAAYGNAVSVAAADAATKAATAYGNAVSYTDTRSATAYSNAISYADTKADAAYSNAITYAATVAATAFSNAVGYAASNTYVNDSFAQLAGATFTGAVSIGNTFTTGNTTINGKITVSGNYIGNVDANVVGTHVLVKRLSNTGEVPTANQLGVGELLINLPDRALYSKDAANVVFQFSTGGGSGTSANGFATIHVASQTDITAITPAQALNIESANGVVLTTNPGTTSLTISMEQDVSTAGTVDFASVNAASITTSSVGFGSLYLTGNTTNLIISNTSGVIGTVATGGNVANVGKQSITGDGTTNTFTLDSNTATADDIIVFADGQYAHPDEDYSVANGQIQFTTAPTTKVRIRYLRNAPVEVANTSSAGDLMSLSGSEDLMSSTGTEDLMDGDVWPSIDDLMTGTGSEDLTSGTGSEDLLT